MDMYINSNEYIYTFAFNVLDNKYVVNVYSFKREDIMLFMKQHGFGNSYEFIQYVPYEREAETKYEDKILKPFIFRSNSNDIEYSVMTTEFILDKCYTNAGDKLTDSCWFSYILPEYNNTLPIIKYLNESIDQLKYADVMDWQSIVDDSTCIELNHDINNDIIRDKLMNEHLKSIGFEYTPEHIQAITIESYINGFATLS